MKDLFIVAAKLAGLIAVYWSITIIVQFGFAIQSLVNPLPFTDYPIGAVPTDQARMLWLIGTILHGVITSAFAFLLLFRTEAVAKFVGVPDKEVHFSAIEHSFLKGGVVLLGLCFFLFSLPTLAHHLSMVTTPIVWHDPKDMFAWIAIVLQIALACLIMRHPERTIHFITKKKAQQPTPPDSKPADQSPKQ